MAEELDLHTGGPGPEARGGADFDGRDSLSLIELTNSILRHRGAIVGVSLSLGLLSATITLLTTRTYTSTATFIPQSVRSPSAISGLAAQFGVSVPGGDPAASPSFYSRLVGSQEVLSDVVSAEYAVGGGREAKKGSLADVLEIAAPDSLTRRSKVIRALDGATTTVLDQKSSVISVSVSMPSARLAQQVASEYIKAINRFNLDRRQSQAAAERKFTEQRLDEVRAQMRQAEDQLQYFLQRNRLMDTPDLQFQRDRLMREVSLRQQVYGTISQAHEQARIDEVRDTPVLTILDRPEFPTRPDPRGTVTKALIAVIIGLFLTSVAAAIRDNFSGRAGHGTGMADFARLRAAAMADLRHPIASVRRSWRSMRHKKAEQPIAADHLHFKPPR